MRMKKTFKFFMMAAIVAAGFTACSSEEVVPNKGGDETGGDGTATYATFNLTLKETKATTYDPPTQGSALDNPTNDNLLAYSDVRLLIFNAATQALEYNDVFGTARKTVLVQAGNKKIFVFANTAGDLSTQFAAVSALVVGTATLTDFYNITYDAGTPQALGATGLPATRTFNIEPLHKHANTGTTGLPASNTNAIEYVLLPNIEEATAAAGTTSNTGSSTTNSFNIELLYMIAKGRLYLGDLEANLTTGTPHAVSNITYTIRNLARKTNFVQNVVASVPRSYYYTDYSITTTAAEFLLDFDLASAMQTAPITTTPGNYLYVPENNNQLLRRGQSSHFVIKATFKPGVVVTDASYSTSGINFETKTLDLSGSLDYLFTLEEIAGIPSGTYFTDLNTLQKAAWLYTYNSPWIGDAGQLAQAQALIGAADQDTKFYSFVNATSWYRLDLGTSTSGSNLVPGVLRGKAYNARINSITGPGLPDENKVELKPEEPVVSMTYISATIEVKDWEPVYQVGELY